MNKKVILISIVLIFLSVGCLKKKPVNKEARVFWGTKEEIVIFLDKPEAMAERWIIRALD